MVVSILQVFPPLIVLIIVSPPAAKPVLLSTNTIDSNSYFIFDVKESQVRPPFIVLKILPSVPQIKPVSTEGNATDKKRTLSE